MVRRRTLQTVRWNRLAGLRLGNPMDRETILRDLEGLALGDALARILSALDAETGTVHRLGGDGVLRLESYAGTIPERLLSVIARIPVGKGMAGLTAERCEPVQICNLQTDASSDARPGARSTGMRGSLCVPMMDDDRLVGVLGVAVGREREFTETESGWLMRAGTILGRAFAPL